MAAAPREFAVLLINSGEYVACKVGETLLAAFIRTGKKGIPVGCRGGGCGICRIEIEVGQVDTKPMSRSQISLDDERAGRLLACSVYPTSDLKVRAIGRMERLMVPVLS